MPTTRNGISIPSDAAGSLVMYCVATKYITVVQTIIVHQRISWKRRCVSAIFGPAAAQPIPSAVPPSGPLGRLVHQIRKEYQTRALPRQKNKIIGTKSR